MWPLFELRSGCLGWLQVQHPGGSPGHSTQDHEDPDLEADAEEGVRLGGPRSHGRPLPVEKKDCPGEREYQFGMLWIVMIGFFPEVLTTAQT